MNNTTKSENENSSTGNENGTGNAVGSCEPGCKCNAPSAGSSRKLKNIILVVIIIAAIAVAARSLMRQSRNERQPESPQFAAALPQNKSEAPVSEKNMLDTIAGAQVNKSNPPEADAPEKADWGEPLNSISVLDAAAADVDAVFILLSKDQNKGPDSVIKEIESAAKTIKSRGVRMRLFLLRNDAPEYQYFSQQVSVPGVLVLVKGRGINGVQAGQVTADRLLQAFVTASQPASACCPPGGSKSGCK